MASEIKLPVLGESVAQGEVLDVKVKAGDVVSAGQSLIEVEAEKSTVEVPSPFDGTLTEVLVKKGDVVKAGQLLFRVDGNGAAPAGAPATPPKAAPKAEEEPKQTTTAAPAAEVAHGTESAPVAPAASGFKPEPAATASPAADQPKASKDTLVLAGPATRQLARELGVDLARVHGTAPNGRVTREDVKGFVRELNTNGGAPAPRGAGITAPPLPDFERWGAVERRPLDVVRRRTAEQMSLAWSLIPHVTQNDLADVTDLDAFRRQPVADKNAPKLTVTAFALKAAAIALKKFPQFNSSLDLAKGQLIVKNYVHVGVAVDTERGLLVPVIRDVDKKNIYQLAKDLTDIAEKSRQKKVTADDMRGGTFTISNLGGLGGTGFTPIVNYPEVAILGLSRSSIQAVFKDGKFEPRLMLPLSLSYDHRVIDGADAARFTRFLADMLQNPYLMLVHA